MENNYLNKAYIKFIEIGNYVTNEISEGDDSRLNVYYGLLKRITNNLSVLVSIPINAQTITAANLIYRSIIMDIYLLIFLFHLDKADFDAYCENLNIDHTKFVRDVLPMQLKLGRIVLHSKENDITDQDIFDNLYDKFQPFLCNEKGKPWIVKKQNRVMDVNNTSINAIKDYFKNKLKDDVNAFNFEPYYMAFRVLSQTVHYSPIGVNLSFGNNKDIVIYDSLILYGANILDKHFKKNKISDT